MDAGRRCERPATSRDRTRTTRNKDRHTRWTVALEQLPERLGHVPGLEQWPTPHIVKLTHSDKGSRIAFKMWLFSLRCRFHNKCPQ